MTIEAFNFALINTTTLATMIQLFPVFMSLLTLIIGVACSYSDQRYDIHVLSSEEMGEIPEPKLVAHQNEIIGFAFGGGVILDWETAPEVEFFGYSMQELEEAYNAVNHIHATEDCWNHMLEDVRPVHKQIQEMVHQIKNPCLVQFAMLG